jgi:hypothetical protein
MDSINMIRLRMYYRRSPGDWTAKEVRHDLSAGDDNSLRAYVATLSASRR